MPISYSDVKDRQRFLFNFERLTIKVTQQKVDLEGNYAYDNSLQNSSIPVPKHSQQVDKIPRLGRLLHKFANYWLERETFTVLT